MRVVLLALVGGAAALNDAASGAASQFGVSHFWRHSAAAWPTANVNRQGNWWDFSHPDAAKSASQSCDCIPGYHDALDITCHVDSGGHLRVSHPHMVCSGDKWKNPLQPDRCLKRHWTGTHGVNFHRCKHTSRTTCTCCDCKDGLHHKCPAGKHRNVPTGACDSCAPGRHTEVANDFSECKDCPVGRFTDGSDTAVCEACAEGTYQPDKAKRACLNCAKGKYTQIKAQTECALCTKGQFQNHVAQSGCQLCDAGTYADVKGLETCKACESQTWQPFTGQLSCLATEVCEGVEYESKAYTATTDRVCYSHTVCAATHQYQTKAA
jgi:hypothetical protein